jgi:hypothetical protein
MSGFCSGRNYFETVFLPYLEQRFEEDCEVENYDVEWFYTCFQKQVFARIEKLHVKKPPKTVNQWEPIRQMALTLSGQTPVNHLINEASVETYKKAIKWVLTIYFKQVDFGTYFNRSEECCLPDELSDSRLSPLVASLLEDLENDEIQAKRSTPYVVKFNEVSQSLNVDGNSIPLNDMEALFTKAILIDKIHHTPKIALELNADNNMVRQTALQINNKVRTSLALKGIFFFDGRQSSVGYVLTDAFEYQT